MTDDLAVTLTLVKQVLDTEWAKRLGRFAAIAALPFLGAIFSGVVWVGVVVLDGRTIATQAKQEAAEVKETLGERVVDQEKFQTIVSSGMGEIKTTLKDMAVTVSEVSNDASRTRGIVEQMQLQQSLAAQRVGLLPDR